MMAGMVLSFEVDPPLTPELCDRILDLWVRVTNAGGAVGFVPPVEAEDVRPTAEKAFEGVRAGADHLVLGRVDGFPAALLFMVDNEHKLKDHWRVIKRVMVAPEAQGRGYGAAIMREAAEFGRRMGLAALAVTVRAGAGNEDFYGRLGYREVGRLPGALRVAPGDDRDEIHMWLPLP